MVTRCTACGKPNRVSLVKVGDPVCGVCKASLPRPRAVAFAHRHRRAVVAALLVLFSVPALAYYGDRAERWNREGVRLAEDGQHQDAVRAFARAVEADPSMGKAHYNMGVSYLHLHHTMQGVICLRTALNIDPGDVDASAALAGAARYRVASLHYRP